MTLTRNVKSWLRWLLGLRQWTRGVDELLALSGHDAKANHDSINALTVRVDDRDSAFQAIDDDWYGGKIVLCFKVRGKDIVRVIDIKRETTMTEYRELSKQLEVEFGIRPRYYDGRMDRDDWLGM